jgi:hypothetical protein
MASRKVDPRRRPKSPDTQIVPIRQCIEWYLGNDLVPLSNDDCTTLSLLADDDRTGEVWDAMRTYVARRGGDGIEAQIDFITFVLTAKNAAERESRVNIKLAAMAAEIGKLEIAEAKKYIAPPSKHRPKKERHT